MCMALRLWIEPENRRMIDRWFRVKIAFPDSASFEMTTPAETARAALDHAFADADYQQLLATSGEWCSLTVCGVARPASAQSLEE